MESKKVDEWALCERGTEIKGKAEVIAAPLEACEQVLTIIKTQYPSKEN